MTGFAEDAATAYEAPVTKAAFYAWVQGREGRYELDRGQIVMMTGATRDHWRVMMAFVRALDARLDTEQWLVGAADLAVEIGEQIRYPDVLVEKAGGAGKGLAADDPIILVEVLSTSSPALDLRIKPAEYTSLPSLEAYIVASQDEPICWVWQREASGGFPKDPAEVKGREASIELSGRGISLPLADIYRGIGTS